MKTTCSGGKNTCPAVGGLNLSSVAICVTLKESLHFTGLKFNFKIKLGCLLPRRGILAPDIFGPGMLEEEVE